MCSATTCETCGKNTWTGCGQHIESVKRRFKDEEWCKCPPEKRKPKGCTVQ